MFVTQGQGQVIRVNVKVKFEKKMAKMVVSLVLVGMANLILFKPNWIVKLVLNRLGMVKQLKNAINCLLMEQLNSYLPPTLLFYWPLCTSTLDGLANNNSLPRFYRFCTPQPHCCAFWLILLSKGEDIVLLFNKQHHT